MRPLGPAVVRPSGRSSLAAGRNGMILSKVADPTYRSCYPQDAEWSQVHQGTACGYAPFSPRDAVAEER